MLAHFQRAATENTSEANFVSTEKVKNICMIVGEIFGEVLEICSNSSMKLTKKSTEPFCDSFTLIVPNSVSSARKRKDPGSLTQHSSTR